MEELEEMLKGHDWYYGYSDDMSYWRSGHSQHKKILAKMKDLGNATKVLELFRKYQPEQVR